MRKISIEEIREGMTLAQEIQDDKGRVLLKKGDPLRTAYKSKLNQWGIEEIFVVMNGETGDLNAVVNPEDVKVTAGIVDKYERMLNKKFSDVSDNVLMNTIKSAAIGNLAYQEAMKNAGLQ